MFHFPPPPDCQQPHYPDHPPQIDPAALGKLCEVWREVVALSSLSMAI